MKRRADTRQSFTTIYTAEHREIIRRLRAARLETGLRQSDAAKKLKMPVWYVQKCEAGQRRIDLVEIVRFAKLYKKPVGFFHEGL